MSPAAGRWDLRAIEARLNATEVCYECRADMQALLAHGRALRAALEPLAEEVATWRPAPFAGDRVLGCTRLTYGDVTQAAAVLVSVSDGEAAP